MTSSSLISVELWKRLSWLDLPGLCLIFMNIHKQPWALLSMVPWSQKHSWGLISICDYSAMAPLELIAPSHHGNQCSGVLRSDHGGSWMFMGALECSWVFLSDPECSSSWLSDKRKMLILKMTGKLARHSHVKCSVIYTITARMCCCFCCCYCFCFCWSQKPTFKVWSKSGQWNIVVDVLVVLLLLLL